MKAFFIFKNLNAGSNNYLQLLCKEIIEFLLYRGYPSQIWPAKYPEKIIVRNFIVLWNSAGGHLTYFPHGTNK